MNIKEIKSRYEMMNSYLNEKTRRLWCATEALAIGRGGISIISRATGVSRTTITEGAREIKGKKIGDIERIRRDGGGRKKLENKDITIKSDLDDLLESSTRGDPESPLKYSSKSLRNLTTELENKNHKIGHVSVGRLLTESGYSLQANKKTIEGTKNNPDRNAQFEYINNKAKLFLEQSQPVISVDTKKKENIGNFKNNGKEYHKKGEPIKVNTYDFINKDLGKVAPYGVYDILNNKGWVNVGISGDTAQFAVESVRQWWYNMGKEAYPYAKEIFINADGGGSNGYRVKLWKVELQKLANELNITIHVSHFPPGTSKWNKIEHRMFSFITKNWRGKPLIDRVTVVNLIGSTKTKTGLEIKTRLDENIYKTKIKVSNKELAKVNLKKDEFHGEWNYSICPISV